MILIMLLSMFPIEAMHSTVWHGCIFLLHAKPGLTSAPSEAPSKAPRISTRDSKSHTLRCLTNQ